MPNIPYLESSDFNTDLTLKPEVTNGKPVVVMCQGVFCGFCTQAKPAFIDFSNSDQVKGKIVAATIQIDSEKDLGQKISQLDSTYRGVPVYLGFNSQGKYVKTHGGNRDAVALIEFAKSL